MQSLISDIGRRPHRRRSAVRRIAARSVRLAIAMVREDGPEAVVAIAQDRLNGSQISRSDAAHDRRESRLLRAFPA
jgi:hypothetical protein